MIINPLSQHFSDYEIELKEILENKKSSRELYDELFQEFSLREKYLKETGQTKDFQEWRNK